MKIHLELFNLLRSRESFPLPALKGGGEEDLTILTKFLLGLVEEDAPYLLGRFKKVPEDELLVVYQSAVHLYFNFNEYTKEDIDHLQTELLEMRTGKQFVGHVVNVARKYIFFEYYCYFLRQNTIVRILRGKETKKIEENYLKNQKEEIELICVEMKTKIFSYVVYKLATESRFLIKLDINFKRGVTTCTY